MFVLLPHYQKSTAEILQKDFPSLNQPKYVLYKRNCNEISQFEFRMKLIERIIEEKGYVKETSA